MLLAALNCLRRIHEADIAHQKNTPNNAEGEYDEDSRKTLYGLLDLIDIRGILPSLSPGVAIKHHPRSIIPGLNESLSAPKDLRLLCEIISGLGEIYEDPSAGLAPLVRERILIDAITGAGELAFAPGLDDEIHSTNEKIFADLVNK